MNTGQHCQHCDGIGYYSSYVDEDKSSWRCAPCDRPRSADHHPTPATRTAAAATIIVPDAGPLVPANTRGRISPLAERMS
jgi:hypothetical protein